LSFLVNSDSEKYFQKEKSLKTVFLGVCGMRIILSNSNNQQTSQSPQIFPFLSPFMTSYSTVLQNFLVFLDYINYFELPKINFSEKQIKCLRRLLIG